MGKVVILNILCFLAGGLYGAFYRKTYYNKAINYKLTAVDTIGALAVLIYVTSMTLYWMEGE